MPGDIDRIEDKVFVDANMEQLGDLILKWAENPAEWPSGTDFLIDQSFNTRLIDDVESFKTWLSEGDGTSIPGQHLVKLPDRIKKILFIQPSEDSYVVRLPLHKLANQSQTDVDKGDTEEVYKPYKFYEDHMALDLNAMSEEDRKTAKKKFLKSRIADCTFAGCM